MNAAAATGRIPALPTLDPAALLDGVLPAPAPAFPLDRIGEGALYYLARNAIVHGLRALGIGAGDVALLPAYHHGVEVEAVRHTGARVEFYRVDRAMRIDLEDVEARLAARPAGSRAVLHVIHYLGLPQAIDEARALASKHDALLLEDCALALFSRDPRGKPLGTTGDLSVFCLYKTLPVPHGGVALARVPLPPGEAPPLSATLHHLAGALIAGDELRHGERAVWRVVRGVSRRLIDRVVSPVQVGTSRLDPDRVRLGASRLLGPLLRGVDAPAIVARRRANYARLLEALGEESSAAGALPPHTCPLFYPLLVEDKPAALAALAARGIEAIDFWSAGDAECAAHAFPEAEWLRRHVMELPIHQDLDEEAVDRVARAVKDCVRHVR